MEEYINEKTIIKDNIYEMFSDFIHCSICGIIMISSFICLNCENRFCRKCMEKLEENKDKCPGKCEFPNIKELTGEKNLINKFKFKCLRGCGKKLKLEEINSHYSLNCPNRKKLFKILTGKELIDYKEKLDEIIYSTSI